MTRTDEFAQSPYLARASVRVRPPARVAAELRPPGSKSLTNRALLLASLAAGRSRLTGCLESEDTRLMRGALTRLGVRYEARDDGREVALVGLGGAPRTLAEPARPIDVGTAGTAARFLTAVLAASGVRARVDGTPRMRERPMAMLLSALRDQGATIRCEGADGYLPISLVGARLRGGELRLSRPVSSQFISALIMSATLAERPTRIILEQGTPSRPYVDMTIAYVNAFGGRCGWGEDGRELLVEPGALTGMDLAIEPDASAASYFLALAAIHGGRVTIPDLGSASLQGDVGFAQLLGRMGAAVEQGPRHTTVVGTGTLRGGAFDLTDLPDMTLTLAVVALYAEGRTRVTGVEILRHHESDRLAVAATELRKLGAEVVEHDDGLTITPPPGGRAGLRPAVIDTYRDHRVAMAFSLAGHVELRDPACVAKTFPGYFDVLEGLGMIDDDDDDNDNDDNSDDERAGGDA